MVAGVTGEAYEVDVMMDLIQQCLGKMLFPGLTPAFDQHGNRVHDMDVVGPAP